MSAYSKHIAKLYSVVSDEDLQKNWFISPTSINASLSLLLAGARDGTAAEIKEVIGLSPSASIKHEELAAFLQDLTAEVDPKDMQGPPDPKLATKISMAYKVYVNKTLSTNKSFEDVALNVYKSETEKIDCNKPSESVAHINEWVNQATCGRIPSIVTEDDVTEFTALILLNTLYFKASWAGTFNQRDEMNFTLSDSTTIQVPYLCMSETTMEIANHSSLDCQCVRVDFLDNKYRVFVLLPNSADGLGKLLRDVVQEPKQLEKVLQTGFENKAVNFFLPSLKMTTTTVDLRELLTKCGVTRLFSANAELEGLVDGKTSVTSMVHKTVLDVNEYGVEAAAVTKTTACLVSLRQGAADFFVNRPYIFGIEEKKRGLPIFIGHINNPKMQ